MAAIIKLGPYTATFADGKWSVEGRKEADLVREVLELAVPATSIPASAPNRELWAAERVCDLYGAELLSYDEVGHDLQEGEVY